MQKDASAATGACAQKLLLALNFWQLGFIFCGLVILYTRILVLLVEPFTGKGNLCCHPVLLVWLRSIPTMVSKISACKQDIKAKLTANVTHGT